MHVNGNQKIVEVRVTCQTSPSSFNRLGVFTRRMSYHLVSVCLFVTMRGEGELDPKFSNVSRSYAGCWKCPFSRALD